MPPQEQESERKWQDRAHGAPKGLSEGRGGSPGVMEMVTGFWGGGGQSLGGWDVVCK